MSWKIVPAMARRAALAGAVLVIAGACGKDKITGPTTGSVQITTTSSGQHVDADGYAVAVDDGDAQPIDASGSITINDVSTGSHTVTLAGLASNCTVGGNPATVTVTAGTAAEASFAITCGPRTLAFESNAMGSFDIFTIKEDGSGRTPLTTDTTFEGFAVWSPDGTTIAFTSLRGKNLDVYTMDAAGGNVTQLTTDPAEDGVAAWSPDGTQLAFASTRSGSAQIWVMNADGTNATQLTHLTPSGGASGGGIMDSLALATEPAWSPDGKTIAFQARPSGEYHIWLVTVSDPSTPAELTTGGDDEAPAWSPDGATLVYASKQSGHYELTEVNVSDKTTTALTSASAYDNRSPVFSPDGKTIAFYSDRTGTPQVWTMDVATKAVTQVDANTADEGRPSWRP